MSDHCPLVLKIGGWDWGPKLSRFKNYWLENHKCKKVVEDSWNGQYARGWMGFVLKDKLKAIKEDLKVWNREEYGSMNNCISRLKKDIEDLDLRGEVNPLNGEEVGIRKEKFNLLWSLLKAKDSLMFQRSRVKWIKEGDSNTTFFHNCMKIGGMR